VKSSAARECAEVVATLFYIDPLDRPELVPLVDQAVALLGSLGDQVIPLLLDMVDAGDVKAQLACGHALGRIGPKVIDPLIDEYHKSTDSTRRALILYALGKVNSPEVMRAADLAVTAALSNDTEIRDTAMRTLGKFAEAIPPLVMDDRVRDEMLHILHVSTHDERSNIRAKAVRSLGKLARCGHMCGVEKKRLATLCHALIGDDETRDWDRAFIVRKEAEEALKYC
jgi:HEAT repeat protein